MDISVQPIVFNKIVHQWEESIETLHFLVFRTFDIEVFGGIKRYSSQGGICLMG